MQKIGIIGYKSHYDNYIHQVDKNSRDRYVNIRCRNDLKGRSRKDIQLLDSCMFVNEFKDLMEYATYYIFNNKI